MKIAIVTDSTAFLPEATKKNKNLSILPIPIIIDGKIYKEDQDIFIDGYYDILNTSKQFPTTSQPSLGEAMELYQSLADKGYEAIISIHLSSGISGFVKNLETIRESLDIKIYPFDSKITSSPMGCMVEKALNMVEDSAEVETILKELELMRDSMGAYLVVDDLHNLVRGGRLTNGAALVGSLLKIKPILHFDDEGKIVIYEKIRSSKKAFQKINEFAEELQHNHPNYRFFIIHANNERIAKEQITSIKKSCPNIDLSLSYFGPVIGTHLGEKAIALGWVKQ